MINKRTLENLGIAEDALKTLESARGKLDRTISSLEEQNPGNKRVQEARGDISQMMHAAMSGDMGRVSHLTKQMTQKYGR